MTGNTIDDQGASEQPQSGNKPLGKQVDNLIVEDEAKRVWELLFGSNQRAGTQDGRYNIGRGTFTEYFVAAFDRLTEGNDLVSLYPEPPSGVTNPQKAAQEANKAVVKDLQNLLDNHAHNYFEVDSHYIRDRLEGLQALTADKEQAE